MLRTYVFDLDGTLCTNTEGDYERAVPLPWAVERVNALKRVGHRVVIFTARGTTTGIDWRPAAERQLSEWGVEYDELLFGKPYGDVYVDDKALHADAWRCGHARELAGPGHAPPRSSAVVEVARTFGGRLVHADDHARSLVESARAAGIPRAPSVAVIAEAMEDAARFDAQVLAPDDEVVIVTSIIGPAHVAFLDASDEPADAELLVTCRLLSQPAVALAPFVKGEGVVAGTDGRGSAWPLARAADGAMRDLMGGDVGIVSNGSLEPLPQAGTAARTALALLEDRVSGDPAVEEILILSMPFCVVPVVQLDGEPVGRGEPGPVAQALIEGWRRLTGVDVAAQRQRLTGAARPARSTAF